MCSLLLPSNVLSWSCNKTEQRAEKIWVKTGSKIAASNSEYLPTPTIQDIHSVGKEENQNKKQHLHFYIRNALKC